MGILKDIAGAAARATTWIGEHSIEGGHQRRKAAYGEAIDDQRAKETKEAEKNRSFIDQTTTAAESAERGLGGLSAGAGLTNVATAQEKAARGLGFMQRKSLANAAEMGALRSSSLEDSRAFAANQRALAMAGEAGRKLGNPAGAGGAMCVGQQHRQHAQRWTAEHPA